MSEEQITQSGKWTAEERASFRKGLRLAGVIFLVVLITVVIMSLLVQDIGGVESIRPV